MFITSFSFVFLQFWSEAQTSQGGWAWGLCGFTLQQCTPQNLNCHDMQSKKQSFFISCVYGNSFSVQVSFSTTGESVIMFLSFNVWYIILDNVWPVMPAKATLFDLKCNPLFDFGTGPRNDIFFNPHGNNILFCKEMLSENAKYIIVSLPCKKSVSYTHLTLPTIYSV